MELFPHVYGQDKTKARLARLLKEGRLPHTMVFYGDEGLGKTTAAFDLADAVTRSSSYGAWREADAEDGDKAPTAVFSGGRVWYLRPEGTELKVEQFRVFAEAMATFDETPHFCILDEAQTMMPTIANAMLKTLEEPEGDVHFILITHDIDALLPTVVSRAERFPFFPLSYGEYSAFLTANAASLPFRTEAERQDAYALSGGNPGLTAAMFSEAGEAEPERSVRFWETVTESAAPYADCFSYFAEDRGEFRRRLQWLMLAGRDILAVAATGEASLARCRGMAERLARLAANWGATDADRALEILKTADMAAKRYISTKNIWDMVLISLIRLRKGK